MQEYIFDNTVTGEKELKEKIMDILPKEIVEHEQQLLLALSDVVILLGDFNLTKNEIVGTPLRFIDGKAYSLFKELNIDGPCTYIDFIKFTSMEFDGLEKNNFLEFVNPENLINSYKNGQRHLKTSLFIREGEGRGLIELHVLLYENSYNGDLMGLTYICSQKGSHDQNEREHHFSEIDPMTGCFTRAALRRIVPEYLSHEDVKATFIMVDLDNFKKANDIGGHHFGDQVLIDMANTLRSCFREEDYVTRVGGDEFSVFIKGVNDRETIRKMVQRLIHEAEKTYETADGELYNHSLSIGIALYPECGTTLDELYRNADEALYRAKALGKNGYSFYKDVTEGKALNEIFKKGFRDSDCRDILDALVFSSIYVIEEATHRILFYNRHAKNVIPNITIGAVCHDMWEESCDKCPIKRLGDGAWARAYDVKSPFGEHCEVTATRMLWHGKTPAILIRTWPEIAGLSENDTSDTAKPLYDITKYDALTGGYTRKGFIEAVDNMRACGNDLRKYAILFINIKGFKAVNELFGPDAGDDLLRTVYTRVSNSTLSPVVGARKESDHFVFLVEIKDLDYNSLHSLLEFRWKVNQQEISIHCRCGIFKIDNNNRSVAGMIDRAKLAKEHITDEFVEPYCVFERTMRVNYVEQMLALATFDEAIERHEFEVYYQPVIDIKTQKIVSAEALVRWSSTEHGMLSPAQFIPVLEQYGYITRLDQFVLKEVSRFQYERLEQGLPIIPITVNLSRMDFYDQSALDTIVSQFKTSELPKGAICFEITESAHGEGSQEEKINFINEIRKYGGKVYLDDFGNGYSTFDMIENYTFDVLKIDMGLIRKLKGEPKVKTIVQTIIYMSHSLEMQVVAEGVEQKEELDILREIGCDFIQGYYYSKPLNQIDFKTFLIANEA